MKKIIIILILFSLLIDNINSSDSCPKYKPGDKLHADNDQNSLWNRIRTTFKLSPRIQSLFNHYFDLKKLVLLFPKEYAQVQTNGRCVLGSYFHGGVKVAIKMEFKKSVRVGYDYSSQQITCHKDLNSPSAEFYIASMVNKPDGTVQDNFIKFYSKISSCLSSEDVNIYIYDNIENSSDLLRWSKNERKSQHFELHSYENKVRRIFRHIFRALYYLLSKNFVYTDFKPMNALIDNHNRGYLIDLESVSSRQSGKVCVYTKNFYPPTFTGNTFQIKTVNADRTLTWTFCFSIYTTVCFENDNIMTKMSSWNDNVPFLNHFGCSSKITDQSNYLKQLLNSCLTKNDRKEKFQNIINYKWFNVSWQIIDE
jgi:hypothetical protein